MNIFIGGAWPYTNESLHLGHIAGLLPGDILARYFRQRGDNVLYVSGSDCHGTPISIRASKENVHPKTITDKYHKEFAECFKALEFSYDYYSRTDQPYHHSVVQEVFKTLLERGYIYNKVDEQTFCESCNVFLPDRYIEGICPICGNTARGDQCDHCSALLEPEQIKDKTCKICGGKPILKASEHFYFALSKLQGELEEYVNSSIGWRENSINLTWRYLREGLRDRAVSRDLPWGVDIPLEGYEGKKIYVWIDAVCGYLSASKQWALEKGNSKEWEEYWHGECTSYYVHGKDNIPFHTIILPALLLGVGGLNLPKRIISSEHLTIEGKKLSKSDNWAVWVPYMIESYDADSIRYFLTINGPEKKDGDFSWREFINRHNAELLGAYGNFVNRTLAFINKAFEGRVPEGAVTKVVKQQLEDLYIEVGEKLEAGEIKYSLEHIFKYVRSCNKYFDEEQPWITIKTDLAACKNTLFNCVQLIANLANILAPFLPGSSDKIAGFLGFRSKTWGYVEAEQGTVLNDVQVLFERIDKVKIAEEILKLGINK